MEKHILSKSTFMHGVQCKKRLYLHKNGRKFGIQKDELTEQQKAIFSSGTNVGELAQNLFPGGIDCSPESFFDFRPSVKQTAELIEKQHPVIYEATFQFEQVLVMMDILVLKDDGWHAYEVKSTNSTKPAHIQDAALQYWVMTHAGIDIQSVNVLHFNKEYVRDGDINIEQLFTWDEVTSDVVEFQSQIESDIIANKECLKCSEIPQIDIGPHCTNPYACDFMGNCWKEVPEYSVLNLTNARGKQWDLYDKGVVDMKDIPIDYPLNDAQKLQVEAERSGEAYFDKEGIRSFVNDLNYPLYFLDFETIMPAIPIFNGTRTYQSVVFQYSLHIQSVKGGEVVHKEFLADPKDAGMRRTLADQLIKDMGTNGDVIVYNQGFESSRLKELVRDYPEYADRLNGIRERMVDLAVPFQRKLYYTAEMRGRYTIKNVLPALVPELSYKDLEIQEGSTASLSYLQMVEGTFKGDELELKKSLLEYCKLDTLAMVRILDVLKGV